MRPMNHCSRGGPATVHVRNPIPRVIMKSWRLCLFIPAAIAVSQSSALAQPVVLTGIVRDAVTLRGIGGVNVLVKNTATGATTQADGRFSLRVDDPAPGSVAAFSHVSYEGLELPVDSVRHMREFLLRPRLIPLPGTEVTETAGTRPDIARDLPQSLSVLDARTFEIRGYVDAGDLLRTDHSVHVDESYLGRKQLSIRGGNADEVTILYDGIKLNSAYDNEYDLSLIDLADIERFEIVRGSNTSLYGPDAFSGAVNIVPKKERDYNLRFHQQVGSYDAGTWGAQAYKDFGLVSGSYGVRSGGSTRAFTDAPDLALTTRSTHHSGFARFAPEQEGSDAASLMAIGRYSIVRIDNARDAESTDRATALAGATFRGAIGPVDDLTLTGAYTSFTDDQRLALAPSSLYRTIDERVLQLDARKEFDFDAISLLAGYQLQRSALDILDRTKDALLARESVKETEFSRMHHGFVAIAKLRSDTGSDFLHTFSADASLRHDLVVDTRTLARLTGDFTDSAGTGRQNWSETVFKFAAGITGSERDFVVNVFIGYGRNVKFPTLVQQVSTPLKSGPASARPLLAPERNTSIEIGASLSRETPGEANISGWQFGGSFFQNSYDNKFRMLAAPGVPVPFYDNVRDARISGFEGKGALFLFDHAVTVDVGISRYYISEASAFPFKPDFKRTVGFSVDYTGWTFQLLWFAEGSQIGLLRLLDGSFAETELPAYSNLDVHASTTVPLGWIRIFASASGMNLLNAAGAELNGLALRDRRYSVTLGIQY